MVDFEDAVHNVEDTVEETFQTAEQEVEDYFFGGNSTTNNNSNLTDEDGNLIYAEDPEDTDCDYLMKDAVDKYWNTVFAMMGLFVLAFLLPYLFCCCNKRWPRCSSRWFFWNGVAQWVMGGLLASSVFLPDCLEKLCGAQFCSAHKYNPGQVWGGVVIGLGVILQMKACGQWRYARKMEKERNIASEAEKGSLVSTIDTMMDTSERGSKNQPYSDSGNDGIL